MPVESQGGSVVVLFADDAGRVCCLDNTHVGQGVVTKLVEENEIETLNVGRPRLSVWNEGYRFALDVIGGVVRDNVEQESP